MTVAATATPSCRSHATQHDDRQDQGRLGKAEEFPGLMKPWRVAKKAPANPPNIAPMANALSLTVVVFRPSDRQASSSSRRASQARPIGSRRNRRVTQLVKSARARMR